MSVKQIGILSLILLCLLPWPGIAEQANSGTETALTTVQLPHTDGYGLLPKPAAFSKAESERMFEKGKQSCETACATPFGEVLGAADGAIGRSNCVSQCIKPKYSFLNLKTKEVTVHEDDPKNDQLHYIGVIYQCVEYARKWWMKNLGITFGSIDSAHEIIYLTEGKNIHTKDSMPLARSINGTAKRPPGRGDLLIYYPDRENPDWRHGHVAVVVSTDLDKGLVAIAEENYDNRPWQDPKAYSRKIRLFEVGGRYTLLDVSEGKNRNSGGGKISGWLYPMNTK